MQPPTVGQGRDVLYRAEAVERAARVHDVSYDLRFDLADGDETYTGCAVVEFGLGRRRRRSSSTSRAIPCASSSTARRSSPSTATTVSGCRDLGSGGAIGSSSGIATASTPPGTASTASSTRRTARPTCTRTSSPSPRTASSPASTSRTSRPTHRLDGHRARRLAGRLGRTRQPASWSPPDAAATTSRRPRRSPATSSRSSPGPMNASASEHGDVALGLFGRRSMRAELERSAEELFEVTAQGLDYFVDLFGRPYPFGKYDQLFVPEFNAGAMENVGAVTLHDRLLFRDPPTYAQRLVRGEVVLHELAHMWFGDLVTMRWWDDLWLNETFATYLSYRCLADATRFRDAWQAFNGDMRPAAHRQDQLEHDASGRHDRGAHRRGRRQLRRHHLREGRRGHQAARGDHRGGCLPRGPARLLRPPRLGQRHAGGLPRRARRGRRPAARRLGAAVAADRRR